jgi:divinyl protochlorophyllide a 8-vinyl-reductase
VTRQATLPMDTARGVPHPSGEATPSGHIGPNAIIQAVAAIRMRHGVQTCEQVFDAAGLAHHLASAPQAMVDEADVVRLHAALVRLLGPAEAAAVAQDAGERTAVYLLHNRIPRLAQRVLSRLPAVIGAAVLCRAVSRHAWTFVGSGRFGVQRGDPLVLTIIGGPLNGAREARPTLAAYYAATLHGVMAGALARRVTSTFSLSIEDGKPACETRLSLGASTRSGLRR